MLRLSGHVCRVSEFTCTSEYFIFLLYKSKISVTILIQFFENMNYCISASHARVARHVGFAPAPALATALAPAPPMAPAPAPAPALASSSSSGSGPHLHPFPNPVRLWLQLQLWLLLRPSPPLLRLLLLPPTVSTMAPAGTTAAVVGARWTGRRAVPRSGTGRGRGSGSDSGPHPCPHPHPSAGAGAGSGFVSGSSHGSGSGCGVVDRAALVRQGHVPRICATGRDLVRGSGGA